MFPWVKCISGRVSDSYSRVDLSSKIGFRNYFFKINTLATGLFAPCRLSQGHPCSVIFSFLLKQLFCISKKIVLEMEDRTKFSKECLTLYQYFLLLYNPIILNFRDLKHFETFWRIILTCIFDGWREIVRPFDGWR